MSVWIFALLFTAPGDIYRCAGEDGSVHFQGRPCEGEQLGAIRSNSAGSATRLREWLSDLPATSAPEPSANRVAAPSGVNHSAAPIEMPPRPTGEHSLAQCSEQFLHCADSDETAMDRCVDQIPRCPGNRSLDCCHAAFVVRYKALRQHRFDRKTAVRNALLGPG